MANQEIRLEGVYNDQSFEIAHNNNVSEITLDFRPRSFNFLPVYHCQDLLEKWGSKFKNFRLLFSEDSNLVMSEIYGKLASYISGKCSFELEYFRQDLDYKKLDTPFFLQVEEIDDIEKAIMTPQLKGLILNNQFLLDLADEGIYSDYLTFLHRLILSNQRNDLEISLKVDWDEVVPHNLYKWFQINQYILTISNKVESHYRSIDESTFLNKFTKVQSVISNIEKDL